MEGTDSFMEAVRQDPRHSLWEFWDALINWFYETQKKSEKARGILWLHEDLSFVT